MKWRGGNSNMQNFSDLKAPHNYTFTYICNSREMTKKCPFVRLNRTIGLKWLQIGVSTSNAFDESFNLLQFI